jgi:Leucine-rich repeat (LRR) protein
MEQAELEQIIEKARLDRLPELYLNDYQLTDIPESISNLIYSKRLHLDKNKLTTLPNSVCNLINLSEEYLVVNRDCV